MIRGAGQQIRGADLSIERVRTKLAEAEFFLRKLLEQADNRLVQPGEAGLSELTQLWRGCVMGFVDHRNPPDLIRGCYCEALNHAQAHEEPAALGPKLGSIRSPPQPAPLRAALNRRRPAD
jgi:hypothetical protein